TVLQLRLHPQLVAVRERLLSSADADHDVELTYVTARGRWYDVSWKGSDERSGGVVTNIGIHFFDLLLWLFGPVVSSEGPARVPRGSAGFLAVARPGVRWFHSTGHADLPFAPEPGRTTFRSIRIDDHEVEFSEGFNDLHTRVYEDVLAGSGFGI